MKDFVAPAPPATFLDALERIDVPQDTLNWPSMMTREEVALLFRLAAQHFSGDGVIIDAGIFLGASTNALATGLSAGGWTAGDYKPVQSYDLAIWVKSMDRYLERQEVKDVIGCESLEDGKCYADALGRLLAPLSDRVDLSIGNIIQTARTERPVEIAFYDCLKAADRDLAVFNAFAPHYMPGHTVVLQQDYFYEGAAEHKLRQELYSESYRFLDHVGSTGVFQVTQPLPEEAFRRDAIPDLPVGDRIELLQQAARRAKSLKGELLVHLSLLEHLLDIGALDAASEWCAELEQRIENADLDIVTRRPEQVLAGLQRRLVDLTA